MSARKTEAGPIPQDPSADKAESGTEPKTYAALERTGADRSEIRGLDPFEAFIEWGGPIDEADYADL